MRLIRWFYIVPLRLRSLFRSAQVEQELDEELRYHVERQTEELIAKGMTEEEARYAALRAMGGVERRKEECRDMRRVRFIEDLMQDVRYSLRTLRKSPGFTAVAVITLALGIGANTAIFSMVNAVLLRSLPYPDPDRLVVVNYFTPRDKGFSPASGSDFLEWRDQAKSFEHIAAYVSRRVDLTGSGERERLYAGMVSADMFATLGVTPALGRAFTPAKEMAIRAAVGAGRLRLIRQFLTESLLLSVIGGAAGLLVAKWGIKLLVVMSPAGIPRIEESSVDGPVLGFTCMIVVLVGCRTKSGT